MTRDEAIGVLESMPATARITKARVRPTDVIVVETDQILSAQTRDNIQADLSRVWPENKVVVLDRTLRVKIATDDANSLVAGDRMTFTLDQLKAIAGYVVNQKDTMVVQVNEIIDLEDGSKTLVMEKVQ